MNAKDLDQILQVLAARFGTTAENLWRVLIRQQYIAAIQESIFIVLTVITWYLVIRFRERLTKFVDEDDGGLPTIVGGIIVVISTLAALACLFEVFGLFINPEYYALKDLLEMVTED